MAVGAPRWPVIAARLGLSGLVIAFIAAMAGPVHARLRAQACEPRSWADWHLAIERACLTPAYVCQNMTASKMLEDPAVVDGLRRALDAGEPAPLQEIDALVAHLRAAYGCEAWRPGRGDARQAPRLPPGHPPIPGAPAEPSFQAPQALTI